MANFTKSDARQAIMDITGKARKAYDALHSGEALNQSYLDARLAYVNSVIRETIPEELLKMAV